MFCPHLLKPAFAALAAAALVQMACGFELYPVCRGKRYMADGWEFKHLEVADLLRHADRLDRETPFDGVIFRIGTATADDLRRPRLLPALARSARERGLPSVGVRL